MVLIARDICEPLRPYSLARLFAVRTHIARRSLLPLNICTATLNAFNTTRDTGVLLAHGTDHTFSEVVSVISLFLHKSIQINEEPLFL